MPDHCIVYNCPNRRGQRDGKKSFYRIPRVVTNLGEVFYERSRLRRTKWLEALKMDSEIVEKKRTMVCSDHFLSGNPSEPHDIDNIDWVPTLKLGSINNEQTNLLNKTKLTDSTASTNLDFLTTNQFKGTNGALPTENGTPTTLATVGIINSLDKEEFLDYFIIDDRHTTKQQQQQRTTYDSPLTTSTSINKKKRKREEILQIPLSSNQIQSQSTATTSTALGIATNDYTNTSSIFVLNQPTKLSKMSQTNLTLDEMNKLLNELNALRNENLLLKNNIMPEYS